MTEKFNELGIKEGRGLLEGLCEYTRKIANYDEEDWNGYLFRLNGKNYAILENPDDGYRSWCEMEETDTQCSNTFSPQEVFVKLFDIEDNMGIALFNIDDGSLILRIETKYYSDYYPCAEMEWHPENLPINKMI